MRKRGTWKFLHNAYVAIQSLLIHGIDRVVMLFVPEIQPKSGPGHPKKVLIVRVDAIGDFILWLDAAKEIRRLFPPDRSRITLLGNSIWTSLAESMPFFDEVLPLERDRFYSERLYRHTLLKQLRRAGFDTVIQPNFSREFLFGDTVMRFSGARNRIGHEGDCANILPFLKRISDNWYTHLVPTSGNPIMELERNAEFLRGLGIPSFRSGIPDLRILLAIPSAIGLQEYYVLFPGAGLPIKQWPVEHFADLAARIHEATGWTGVICGGPAEERLGDLLMRCVDAPMENRTGRTTLNNLVSVIAGARIVVTNDTSAVHIAAAVSTPSVCIVGGGHYRRFIPYHVETSTERPLPLPAMFRMDCYDCNWDCIFDLKKGDPAPCVRNVSVAATWEAIRHILKETDGDTSGDREMGKE